MIEKPDESEEREAQETAAETPPSAEEGTAEEVASQPPPAAAGTAPEPLPDTEAVTLKPVTEGDEQATVPPASPTDEQERRRPSLSRIQANLARFDPDVPWLERVLPNILYLTAGAVAIVGLVLGVAQAVSVSALGGLRTIFRGFFTAPVVFALGYVVVLLSRISRQLASLTAGEKGEGGEAPEE